MLSEFSLSIERVRRHSAFRFLVVGVLSFVVDLGALVLLHGGLKIPLPVATGLAYAFAFVVNFGLNRIWAFEANGAVARQLRRYLYLCAVNLGLSVVFVPAIAWAGLPYVWAKSITAAGIAVANYFVSRRWIFVSQPVSSSARGGGSERGPQSV